MREAYILAMLTSQPQKDSLIGSQFLPLETTKKQYSPTRKTKKIRPMIRVIACQLHVFKFFGLQPSQGAVNRLSICSSSLFTVLSTTVFFATKMPTTEPTSGLSQLVKNELWRVSEILGLRDDLNIKKSLF